MAHRRNRLLSVIVRVALSLFFIGAGIGVYLILVETQPEPGRSDHGSIAPRVLVMTARAVEVRRQWAGYGSAAAMDSADVPARVTATVIELPPQILAGAWVEPGQLLVRLDDSDFQRRVEITTQAIEDIDAQLARIEIEEKSWQERVKLAADEVELSQAEYERALRAREQQAANEREVDQAKQALIRAMRDETAAREEFDKLAPRRRQLRAQRQGQEAQRRLAEQNVERCRIASPLGGVLQLVDVEVGESLTEGQRVARVVDLGRIEVPLKLPAGARASVRAGDVVLLFSVADESRTWPASVARIAPEDDLSTRTMTVYVEVKQEPKASRGLAPGQFVGGRVISSQTQQRWVVPRRSVDGDRILLVEDGRIEGRGIDVDFQVETEFDQLQLPDRQWVVLRNSLDDGALVVLNPTRSLTEGRTVDPATAGRVARLDDGTGDAPE